MKKLFNLIVTKFNVLNFKYIKSIFNNEASDPNDNKNNNKWSGLKIKQIFLNTISLIFLVFVFYDFIFSLDYYKFIGISIAFVISYLFTSFVLNNFKYSNNILLKMLPQIVICMITVVACVFMCYYFSPIYSKGGELIINKNYFIPSLGGPRDLIENWYEFLSHLTTAQLGALTHIFSSIFILTCLLTIISIVYSDFLLDYLKLEVKYPKLARLIKLRRAFKHFYLFINFMLIIITLLALIYVNFTILF